MPAFVKFGFKNLQLLLQCFILADWILYILVNDKGMNMTHTFSEIKKKHTHMYQNYLQLHCSIKCDMVLEGSQSQAEVVTVVLLKTEVSGM